MSPSEALGHLPRLPGLDTEDIRAVRRFLPGKLLSRTAALLSLALLALGFAGSVDQSLRRLLAIDLSPWPRLHYALLFGLPLLAVAAQLLIEWRAELRRRALRRLAVRTAGGQSGYFRIGPYSNTADDRSRFGRADRAHERVLGWIEQSTSVPLCLTGDSGSGKSSLLNAFVLPVLRERGWTVIEARAWQDPQAALLDALGRMPGSRRPRPGEDEALRHVIIAATRRAAERLLIVLDQFEEFVILGKPRQQEAFAHLLADLRANPVPGLRLLLVLRSDYQTFLDDIGLPPLRFGDNFLQVGRFSFAAASDFLARSGLGLEPAAIDRLLTSSAELDETPGLVRPITLNVVGHVLATGKGVAPSLDAGQLVRRYVEQVVGQPAIRDFVPRVLEQLVTEQATKRPRSEQDLAAAAHLRRAEVRAVLNGLGEAALARPLDAERGVWELSHDFVARAVSRHLGRRRRDLWRRSLPYAGPALLAIMAVVAGSLVAWGSLSLDRTRSELADLGFAVASVPVNVPGFAPGGVMVVARPDFHITDDSLARAGPLLARLPPIYGLSLGGTAVETLGPIRGLTALRLLMVAGTKVGDLAPIEGLKALQQLDLSGTRVAILRPLAALPNLQRIILNQTQVRDLEPLRGLRALHSLALTGTRVRDLAPLRALTALQALGLRGTAVVDIEPLAGLTALQTLDLAGVRIDSLEPIEALPGLQTVYLSGQLPQSELVRFGRFRLERKLHAVSIQE